MLHKKRDAHLYIIFKYLRLFFIVFFSFFITQGNSKNMLNYFCLKSHFFVLFGLIFVRGSNQREGRGGGELMLLKVYSFYMYSIIV